MGILEILTWALPSGCLASLVTWLISRKTHDARGKKEREDIYKQLYDNLGTTVIGLQDKITQLMDENIKDKNTLTNRDNEIRRIKTILHALINRAVHCNHWRNCPLRSELQKYNLPEGTADTNTSPLGLSNAERNAGVKLRAGPEEDSSTESECGGCE